MMPRKTEKKPEKSVRKVDDKIIVLLNHKNEDGQLWTETFWGYLIDEPPESSFVRIVNAAGELVGLLTKRDILCLRVVRKDSFGRM